MRHGDQRLKSLVLLLIKHLRACVNEMSLTDQEFEFAWDFMTRMAAKTGPERNEFILLADVLGVSQLIESLNHADGRKAYEKVAGEELRGRLILAP